MAEIPVQAGDILRATATFLTDGVDVCQWVWNLQVNVGGILDTNQLVTAGVAQMESAWVPLDQDITDNTEGSTLEYALYDDGTDKWNTIATGLITSLVGTSITSYMPLGSALLLKLFSERAKALGKKFMFALTESDIVNGQWDASVLANVLAWGAIQFAPTIAGTIVLVGCVFNQLSGDVNLLTGIQQTESNAAYQRRRKPGAGL